MKYFRHLELEKNKHRGREVKEEEKILGELKTLKINVL